MKAGSNPDRRHKSATPPLSAWRKVESLTVPFGMGVVLLLRARVPTSLNHISARMSVESAAVLKFFKRGEIPTFRRPDTACRAGRDTLKTAAAADSSKRAHRFRAIRLVTGAGIRLQSVYG